MKNISLICPTIGRTTIGYMVATVLPQLKEKDELIIVADGPIRGVTDEFIRDLASDIPQIIYRKLPHRVGDFGCTPCDVGIRIASGDAVFFIGDDDYLEPDAFEHIRAAVEANPDVPHLFAMMHTGRVLKRSLAACTVSGQQIVVPRDMSRMPTMADCPAELITLSDHVFIEKVDAAWEHRTIMHDEIICTLPQQNHGGDM